MQMIGENETVPDECEVQMVKGTLKKLSMDERLDMS